MKKYFSLVEARVRDAADILTQMPQDQKDAEEALKAQYKRMNDTLEAVVDKVDDDIDPIPMEEPKSKTTSTLETSYGPDEKDSETNPESDEPVFKPGAKVLIHNPKTKHWDRSAIVINWRHGRTYVLEDGTQRVTRRVLWLGEKRHENHFIPNQDAPYAGKDTSDAP